MRTIEMNKNTLTTTTKNGASKHFELEFLSGLSKNINTAEFN